MKIAVMMRAIDHDSGFQSYVIGLMNALLGFEDDHRYVLLYRTARFLGQFAWSRKVKEILVTAPHKFLWDQVAVPWHAWRERPILFSTQIQCAFSRALPRCNGPARTAAVGMQNTMKFDVFYEHLMCRSTVVVRHICLMAIPHRQTVAKEEAIFKPTPREVSRLPREP